MWTLLRSVALAGVFLAATACGGGDDEDDATPLDVPTSPALEVVGTEMAFTPSEIAVEAGEVTVTLRNEGAILHDLRIGTEPFIVEAKAGETVTRTLHLDPGRYELYCSLPGHSEGGMVGELEVR